MPGKDWVSRNWKNHPPTRADRIQRPGKAIQRNGGGGIRTLDGLPHAGFQDRCNRPLCHPSEIAARHYRIARRRGEAGFPRIDSKPDRIPNRAKKSQKEPWRGPRPTSGRQASLYPRRPRRLAPRCLPRPGRFRRQLARCLGRHRADNRQIAARGRHASQRRQHLDRLRQVCQPQMRVRVGRQLSRSVGPHL